MSSETLPSVLKKILRRLSWGDICENYIVSLAESARKEDLEGYGLQQGPLHPEDVSTCVSAIKGPIRAQLVAHEPLIVCGMGLVSKTLKTYGGATTFIPNIQDGSAVEAGTVLGIVQGDARTVLAAERVILNFIQRLSGIATHTRRYVEQLGNSSTRLLDTRKTTPGWRVLEKYAVGCGGGWNHRLGLFDRVMLKDNHIASLFSEKAVKLIQAVEQARSKYPDLIIEIEVDCLEQLPPVLEAKPDIILLDNFRIQDLIEAKKIIQTAALIEASGGITLDNIQPIGQLGLDFISSGALTHQSTCKDIGLDCL